MRVRAHPPLLAQLVDNLLDNACKYSPPGSPVVVRLQRPAGFAALTVEDRGQGLSQTEQARVFQPFYRSAEARNRGQAGVGLGLALAERIVIVFGGTIRVESEPGQGSRFEVLLSEEPAGPGNPSGRSEVTSRTSAV
jgi:signal transduction histidine kinase